jgi:hypothetical protein
MHLSLGQEAWPLCLLGVFSFIYWFFSSIFLYCVHAYQNRCYMCTKISVIQWLASSDRLAFRKKSCNLNAVLAMACSLRNNILGFWT